MAQIRVTAKALLALIDRVRPTVEDEAHRLAKNIEAHYAMQNKAVGAVEKRMTPEEIRVAAENKAHAYNKDKAPWRPARAAAQYMREVEHEETMRIMNARREIVLEYLVTRPAGDQILPTLSYLSALARTLDPENEIILSEEETAKIKRAAELANATIDHT